MTTYAPPTRITLISHPATREQKAGIFPRDEELDASTLSEVAASMWKPIANSQMLVAPERRTRQTAAALGLDAAEALDLRDCDFGRWSGQSLEALEPEGMSQWLSDIVAAPHGGESYRHLMARVGKWLDGLRGAGSVVAVTHSSIIRAAVVHALELSPHQAFLRLEIAPMTTTDLRFSGGAWRVRSLGVPLR